MTVPAPRGGDTGQEQTTVLGILVETTRRIEDTVARGFDNVNTQLARLPEVYVARREFDRYRDERAVEIQGGLQKHDRDIAELRAAQDKEREAREKQEEQERADAKAREQGRRVEWRWRIGLAVGAAVSFGSQYIHR